MPKNPDRTSKKHRKFITTLSCCACGRDDNTVQPAHIRHRTDGGTGLKPSDCWIVPLCHRCHIETQHRIGELPFWTMYGGVQKAKLLATFLWQHSGDREECREAVVIFRKQGTLQ